MLDYTNVNTFQEIAQFQINPSKGLHFTTDMLKGNAIIYCKTDFLPMLFDKLKFTNRKYILISNSSDYEIDEVVFRLKPPCIVKWFAQNAAFNHPDLIPIPIGLVPAINTEILSWFSDNVETLKSNEKDKTILYCNWNPLNSTFRDTIFTKLEKNDIKYFWDRKKDIKEIGGVHTTNLSFKDYAINMSKHKFVVSPYGNGLDCHRTWEALYMECFPIVIKHNVYKEYDDLPIIQVRDYSEVTYELLNSYLERTYNYEKLTMNYWKERIYNEFKKI